MIRYKPTEVKDEAESGAVQAIKVEEAMSRNAQTYKPRALIQPGTKGYPATKARFGPLASTDPDRKPPTQKDRAFAINSLHREPLSIDEEEQRVIESRVQERMDSLVKEVYDKAEKEGFAKGHAEGHAEAFSAFQVEGLEKLKHLESLIASAEKSKDEIFRANERFLISLVYRICKMILLRELQTDREYLVRLTRDLIERTGIRDGIRLRLNPEDFLAMGSLKEGLETYFGNLKNLQIESSSTVSRGSCVIESEWNAIDANLDTQMKAVETALLGKTTEQILHEREMGTHEMATPSSGILPARGTQAGPARGDSVSIAEMHSPESGDAT